MGSSKINRVTAHSISVAINLRLIRNSLIATTRDGDEPAYRSAAAPQLGDGLHDVPARAKRAQLPLCLCGGERVGDGIVYTTRDLARIFGRADRSPDDEDVGAGARDLYGHSD